MYAIRSYYDQNAAYGTEGEEEEPREHDHDDRRRARRFERDVVAEQRFDDRATGGVETFFSPGCAKPAEIVEEIQDVAYAVLRSYNFV